MGAIEATLDAIAAACGGACQVVAICGRNKKLARRLHSRRAPALHSTLVWRRARHQLALVFLVALA